MSTLMNFSPAGGARPSTVIGPHAIIWLSGSAVTPPAAVTPGSASAAPRAACRFRAPSRRSRVLPAAHRQLERQHVRRIEAGGHVLELREAANQQPGADQQHHRQRQLGDDQQAPHVAGRGPTRAPAADAPRPRSFRFSCRSTPAQPQRRRETEEHARQHRHAEREQQHACRRSRSRAAAARSSMPSTRMPSRRPVREQQARRTPPATASSTLSVSSCRTMRPRLAPRAARTAISRWRASARESSRFATFAQAISSTNATAPISTTSAATDAADDLLLQRHDRRTSARRSADRSPDARVAAAR